MSAKGVGWSRPIPPPFPKPGTMKNGHDNTRNGGGLSLRIVRWLVCALVLVQGVALKAQWVVAYQSPVNTIEREAADMVQGGIHLRLASYVGTDDFGVMYVWKNGVWYGSINGVSGSTMELSGSVTDSVRVQVMRAARGTNAILEQDERNFSGALPPQPVFPNPGDMYTTPGINVRNPLGIPLTAEFRQGGTLIGTETIAGGGTWSGSINAPATGDVKITLGTGPGYSLVNGELTLVPGAPGVSWEAGTVGAGGVKGDPTLVTDNSIIILGNGNTPLANQGLTIGTANISPVVSPAGSGGTGGRVAWGSASTGAALTDSAYRSGVEALVDAIKQAEGKVSGAVSKGGSALGPVDLSPVTDRQDADYAIQESEKTEWQKFRDTATGQAGVAALREGIDGEVARLKDVENKGIGEMLSQVRSMGEPYLPTVPELEIGTEAPVATFESRFAGTITVRPMELEGVAGLAAMCRQIAAWAALAAFVVWVSDKTWNVILALAAHSGTTSGPALQILGNTSSVPTAIAKAGILVAFSLSCFAIILGLFHGCLGTDWLTFFSSGPTSGVSVTDLAGRAIAFANLWLPIQYLVELWILSVIYNMGAQFVVMATIQAMRFAAA